MNFNFQTSRYYALVNAADDTVPARVSLTEELSGVWTLTIYRNWGTVVFCETFRSDDPLKDASDKLATLGYSG